MNRSARIIVAGSIICLVAASAYWYSRAPKAKYTKMPPSSYIHGNSIDEAISMRKDVNSSGIVRDHYFHGDDLFNVALVTDDAGAGEEPD